MAANRCPNPNCEYFNRTLPNNAKVCPMCGTALGPVNAVAPAPAPPSPPAVATQPPPVVDRPAYQTPTTPPAYQPPAPPPVYQPPAPPPVYHEPAPYVHPAPAPPVYAPPPHPARPVLRLIHTSRREFHLPGEQGYIGRRGQTSRTVPEIDLAGIPNEGIVSRTHARVYWDWSQNAYMLVDNNSRNGTYLNGNFLTPNIQYRLNHGDLLQLGQNNLVCFTVAVM